MVDAVVGVSSSDGFEGGVGRLPFYRFVASIWA